MTLKQKIKSLIPLSILYYYYEKRAILEGKWWKNHKLWGYLDPTCIVEEPLSREGLSLVFLHKNTNLRHSAKIIIPPGSKFIMKKYSVCAPGLTVVTGNHRPIVGLPHILTGSNHIRDIESDIVIEEAVWCGVNVTLLHGAHLGRGCIIGGCSMVNKEIPPYAVAVGSPAKIIASVFTIDQILRHEELIYPEEERFTREYLEELFNKYYKDKKSIGLDVDLTSEEILKLMYFDRNYNIDLITEDYAERIKQNRI